MAAPQGNKFWTLRTTHGRAREFEDPKELEKACMEYFEKTEERNDWDEDDWVGKDAKKVNRHHKTPFTINSLCIFLDISRTTWFNYKETFNGKTDEVSQEFMNIITRVEDIIYTQKFEGAVTGHFKDNIIARDLGLADKSEITEKREQPLFGKKE